MMRKEIHVGGTQSELWRALATVWRETSEAAVSARGYFTAALSGGSTPENFYRCLARETGLPWQHTHLFLVDERLVPPESPESNARLIRETLLDGIGQTPAGVHFARTDFPDAGAAAAAYARNLLLVFAALGAIAAEFDLVLLGIGTDGHTASLFPGSDALAERAGPVAGVPAAAGRAPRLTLTLPVINAARRVIFVATGAGKRAILAQVLAGDQALPAARVNPSSGRLEFFVDREAFPASGASRQAT